MKEETGLSDPGRLRGEVWPSPRKKPLNFTHLGALQKSSYKSLLEFSEYLKSELAELNPKDMIDVQSFMWCIAP